MAVLENTDLFIDYETFIELNIFLVGGHRPLVKCHSLFRQTVISLVKFCFQSEASLNKFLAFPKKAS